jgi:flagellar motor switch protein FliM
MLPDEPILSPEELEALSGGAPESAFGQDEFEALQAADEPPIVAYDLTSEDRPVRGHLPALDLIHTTLAEWFGTSLSRTLGVAVKVRAEDTQLSKLGATLSYIPSPSCIGVLELQPLTEPALLVIDPALVLALMTRFYGAADTTTADIQVLADRPFTPLERHFGRYVCERFGEAMSKAWAPVADLRLAVTSIELSPRFAGIVPAGDVVVTAVFEVTAGPIVGHVQLVLPYASLRSYHRVLQSSVRHGDSQRLRGWQDRLEDHLAAVDVQIMAELGHASLPMSRLATLQVGHVLRLQSDRESPLVVCIEGNPKLLGRLTVENGSIALRLEAWLGTPAAATEAGRADDFAGPATAAAVGAARTEVPA